MAKKTSQNSGRAARRVPPVGRRFPKGVSGNPGGRPKGLRALFEEKYPNARAKVAALYMVVAFGTDKQVKRQLGAATTRNLKDRLEAATWLAERLDGRPTQSHELTGRDGGPIQTQDVADAARDTLLKKLAQLADRVTPPTQDPS